MIKLRTRDAYVEAMDKAQIGFRHAKDKGDELMGHLDKHIDKSKEAVKKAMDDAVKDATEVAQSMGLSYRFLSWAYLSRLLFSILFFLVTGYFNALAAVSTVLPKDTGSQLTPFSP